MKNVFDDRITNGALDLLAEMDVGELFKAIKDCDYLQETRLTRSLKVFLQEVATYIDVSKLDARLMEVFESLIAKRGAHIDALNTKIRTLEATLQPPPPPPKEPLDYDDEDEENWEDD